LRTATSSPGTYPIHRPRITPPGPRSSVAGKAKSPSSADFVSASIVSACGSRYVANSAWCCFKNCSVPSRSPSSSRGSALLETEKNWKPERERKCSSNSTRCGNSIAHAQHHGPQKLTSVTLPSRSASVTCFESPVSGSRRKRVNFLPTAGSRSPRASGGGVPIPNRTATTTTSAPRSKNHGHKGQRARSGGRNCRSDSLVRSNPDSAMEKLLLYRRHRAGAGDRLPHVRVGLNVAQFVVVENAQPAAAERIGHRFGHFGLGFDELGPALLDAGVLLLLSGDRLGAASFGPR